MKNMCKVVKSCLAHYAFITHTEHKIIMLHKHKFNIKKTHKKWKIIDLFSLQFKKNNVP